MKTEYFIGGIFLVVFVFLLCPYWWKAYKNNCLKNYIYLKDYRTFLLISAKVFQRTQENRHYSEFKGNLFTYLALTNREDFLSWLLRKLQGQQKPVLEKLTCEQLVHLYHERLNKCSRICFKLKLIRPRGFDSAPEFDVQEMLILID